MQSLLVLLFASMAIALPAGDTNSPLPPLKEGEVCAYAAGFGGRVTGPRPELGKCGAGLFCDLRLMATDGPGICRSTENKILKEGEICANAFQWGPPSTQFPHPKPGKCGLGLFCDLSAMAGDGPGRCAKNEKKILKEGELCVYGPTMTVRGSRELGKCGFGLYCDTSKMFAATGGYCAKTENRILKEGEVCASAFQWGPHETQVPRANPGKCGPGLFCDMRMMMSDGPGVCKPGTGNSDANTAAATQ